jgi:hypothetical protein
VRLEEVIPQCQLAMINNDPAMSQDGGVGLSAHIAVPSDDVAAVVQGHWKPIQL